MCSLRSSRADLHHDRVDVWAEAYEDLLSMTETLVTIIDDFPEQAWHSPE